MRISIIGAGRVGRTLGRLAHQSGHEVGDIVCTSRRSARSAVAFIGAGTPHGAAGARLSPSGLILISTPDDRIEDAVKLILSSIGETGRPAVLHTSGALSSEALSPLRAQGFSIGSCHPLQTFPRPSRSAELVRSTWFCIEGDARAVKAARRLVRNIGGHDFEIPAEMKSLYHASAVMASAGVAALVSISLEMLGRCGLKERESIRVLLPLVEATVANIRRAGPALAVTGPVRRGDRGTVERNMKAVGAIDSDWLDIYKKLAERSITLSETVGTDGRALEEIRRLLSGSARQEES